MSEHKQCPICPYCKCDWDAYRSLEVKVAETEAALIDSNELLQKYFDLFTKMKKQLEDSKQEGEDGN